MENKIEIKSAEMASLMMSMDLFVWDTLVDQARADIFSRGKGNYNVCCEIADSDDVGFEVGPVVPDDIDESHSLYSAVCEAKAILAFVDHLKDCSIKDLVGAARLIEIDMQRTGLITKSNTSITDVMLSKFF